MNFAPNLVDHHFVSGINSNGHCLVKHIPIPKKSINLDISCTLNPQVRSLNTDLYQVIAYWDL